MAATDPRVDRYIADAAPFAQPLLEWLRAQVHAACPTVEETVKWRAPSFVYRGRILAFMAAFQRHASFGFWQHAQVMGEDVQTDGMGSLGRLVSKADLPSQAALRAWIRRAMAVIDEAPAARPRARKAASPAPEVPEDLSQALADRPAAARGFAGLSASQRRDYTTWINEARRADTRARRTAQAVEWLAQGLPRDWKYRRP